MHQGFPFAVPTWQRCLHALYFGVIYYWIARQRVLPVHLERCANQRQQYYDAPKGRWHSPLSAYERMPWILPPIEITDLQFATRAQGRYSEYTLPAASLLTLPYKELQEVREASRKYLDRTRHQYSDWSS